MRENFVSNYFGFNKQQRNGLLVLVCISFFLFLVRIIYPHFITPADIEVKNLPLIEKKLDDNYATTTSYKNTAYKENSAKKLFKFDPNTVSHEQLLDLGFKEKTATIFIKFRSRGFVFRKKEDLKKVFGISEKLYASVEPYIVISKSPENNSENNIEKNYSEIKSTEKKEVQPTTKIALNTADSATFTTLNGIGAGYAKRIIKYRTLLGGFVSVDQLKEVYGFSEELFEKIKENVYLDQTEIKKINLNKDEFKTINKHPYIGYELTKIIFDWRKKTTITPTNLKDILNDPSLYARLMPYLAFD